MGFVVGVNKMTGVRTITFGIPELMDIAPFTAGYSLRKLNSTATVAIRVRRSDASELDIGFDSSGNLNIGALTAFAGTGTATVTKIYDQSGNGWDMVQATVFNQPNIVINGIVQTLNGRAAINFGGDHILATASSSSFTTGSGDCATFVVAQHFSAGTRIIYSLDPHGARVMDVYQTGSQWTYLRRNTADDSFTDTIGVDSPLTQRLVYALTRASASNIEIYVENESNGPTAVTGAIRPNLSTPARIGNDYSGAFPFVGLFQEVIHYGTTLNPKDLLHASANAYYRPTYLLDIYTGAQAAYSLRQLKASATFAISVRRSSDNNESAIGFINGELDTAKLLNFVGGGNGFISTWYDQSGNGIDAEQFTLTAQPQIVVSGALSTVNGKPNIKFLRSDAGSGYLQTASVSGWTHPTTGEWQAYTVARSTGYGTKCIWIVDEWGATGSRVTWFSGSQSNILQSISFNGEGGFTSDPVTPPAANTPYLLQAVRNQTHLETTVNKVTDGATALTGSVLTGQTRYSLIGIFPSLGFAHQGDIQELICFPNATPISNDISNNIMSFYSLNDSDAEAFITAAGITNSNQKEAIRNLVGSAKTNGWWSKCSAIYPIVGGNANAHKYNLKDPRDLDAAFRLVFVGGVNHDATGMQSNGTDGYAETNLIPNTVFSAAHEGGLSFYSMSNIAENRLEIGPPNNINFNIWCRWGDNITYSLNYSSNYITVDAGRGDGFFSINRSSSTDSRLFRNGVQIGSTDTTSGTTKPTTSINLFNRTAGTPGVSTRKCAFATISGLSIDTAMQALMAADINRFQAALGRNVY
jgi:hypothetical protein